jgi:hypothetical protein
LAIDAIRPNASSKMLRLDASSTAYKIPVSSFSMVLKCFMVGGSFLWWDATVEEALQDGNDRSGVKQGVKLVG